MQSVINGHASTPGGNSAQSNNFGEFVLSAHLYVLSILLCADLAREPAPLVNLTVNVLGATFFLVLAAIQFNTWRGLELARHRYRDLTGLYPFWHDPTIPRVMAFAAMFVGFLLLVSAGLSVLILTKDTRRKKVRFHQEDVEEGDAEVGQLQEEGDDDDRGEKKRRHKLDDSGGGISGSLGVQESE